ncbi:MAG: DUF4352 domain-containing protein [Chloroflexota bacterium]|nr:DUF4352 domain-containing protein [Chloroflexota bacterium]
MRRERVGLVAVAAVLLAALVMIPLRSGPESFSAAQDAGTPPPEPPSVEALQTQIAVLEAELALVGGVELELIRGRLGGSRASFDAAYGAPVGYVDAEANVSPDPPLEGDSAQLIYDAADIGEVTATFTNGRATHLTVTPPRSAAQLLPGLGETAWTLEEANAIGSRFSPADASAGTLISEQTAPAAGVELTVQASSAALAALFPRQVADGSCGPVAEVGTFTATLLFSSAEEISAVTYATGGTAAGSAVGSLAPTTPSEPGRGRADRGGNANVTSSLGGRVTANGVQVEAFQIRPDADGVAAPAADQVLTAIDVAITNNTNHNVTYDLPDFVLVDSEGREVAAICGGLDPAITLGELAPGESIAGWVTFQAPADFVPVRFVFLVDNARIGFNL